MTARPILKSILAGCTAFLLAGCWALMQPSGYVNGEQVAAKWSTSWYAATVIGRDGDNWVVKYSDGTTGIVKPEDMRHLLQPGHVYVGQHVYAVWMSGSWYAGKVVAVDDKGATVKWDDGSSPSFAPYGKIVDYEAR